MLRHSYEYMLIVLACIYIVIYIIAVRNKYINKQHNRSLVNPINIYKYLASIFRQISKNLKSFLTWFSIFLALNIVFARFTGYLAMRRATPHLNIDSLTWLEVFNYMPDLLFISFILVMLLVIIVWIAQKEGWK